MRIVEDPCRARDNPPVTESARRDRRALSTIEGESTRGTFGYASTRPKIDDVRRGYAVQLQGWGLSVTPHVHKREHISLDLLGGTLQALLMAKPRDSIYVAK